MKRFLGLIFLGLITFIFVGCESIPQLTYSINDIVASIKISYQDGDSESFVTKNITLPSTSPLDDKAEVTWSSSNNDAISTAGIVTRQGEDVEVKLKFDVKYGDFTVAKNLKLTVIGTNVKISFNSKGGSVVDDISAQAGEVLNLPAPTREGYNFVGWFVGEDAFEDTVVPNESVTLTASWSIIENTIDYDLDGATANNNPDVITINDAVTLKSPEKEGYTFIGWYLDEGFSGEPVTVVTSSIFNGTFNLYAKFEIGTYTVSFNTNNGSTVTSITDTYGSYIDAPLDPTREGYTFGGWYTDSSYSELYVFDVMPSKDTTVYAKWLFDGGSYTGYYDGAEGLSGDPLITYLNTLLHNGFHGVTYRQVKDYYLAETDVDPSNSNNVILIYTGQSVDGTWDSGTTYNTEHVWPQSLLEAKADNSTVNSASDLHHLRPANPVENSRRGNKWYSEVGSTVAYEPRDEVKGDLARMLFYLDIMYPELTLVDLGPNEEPSQYEMGDLSTLISWNRQDPVDAFEMTRNEAIYGIQGNRNPFVDHPEFVDLIWGVETTLLSVPTRDLTTLTAMI